MRLFYPYGFEWGLYLLVVHQLGYGWQGSDTAFEIVNAGFVLAITSWFATRSDLLPMALHMISLSHSSVERKAAAVAGP